MTDTESPQPLTKRIQDLWSGNKEYVKSFTRYSHLFLSAAGRILLETLQLKLKNPILTAAVFPLALKEAEGLEALEAAYDTSTLILIADEIMESKITEDMKDRKLMKAFNQFSKRHFGRVFDGETWRQYKNILSSYTLGVRVQEISYIKGFPNLFLLKYLEMVRAMGVEQDHDIQLHQYERATIVSNGFPLVAMMVAYKTHELSELPHIFEIIDQINSTLRYFVDLHISNDDFKSKQNIFLRYGELFNNDMQDPKQRLDVQQSYINIKISSKIDLLNSQINESKYKSLKTFKFSIAILNHIQYITSKMYGFSLPLVKF